MKTQYISPAACVMLLISLASDVLAYEPPVGVPDPSWGPHHPIDAVAPSWPSGWPASEVANHYYVDNTHPAATDVGNPYGYPDKPRREIPEITFEAGAYVEIHGTGYTGAGQIIFSANGTPSAPVWFRGPSVGAKPVIRGELIPKGNYLFIENLAFDTSNKTLSVRSHSGSTVNYVSIRNNDLSGPGTSDGFSSAVLVGGATATNRSSNIVIYNNSIHHFGDANSVTENDYHGIGVGRSVDKVWILNNHIHHMGGDSVQIGSASIPDDERPQYIYVGNNEFHEDRENAVDIKEANHVVVSSNRMYGYKRVDSASGEVVVIHNDPNYIWILNNVISNGEKGVVTTGSANTWFFGNVVYNIHRPSGSGFNAVDAYQNGAAIHFRGSSSGGVINNTLYNYDVGIQLVQGGSYDVIGNIFAARAEASGADLLCASSSIAAGMQFDYNLFSKYVSPRVVVGSSAMTLDSYKASSGKCVNCIVGEPGFSNATANDYSITGASQGVNKGATHRIYTEFLNLYKIDLARDVIGNERIIGGKADMGAYEYQLPFAPPAALPLMVR